MKTRQMWLICEIYSHQCNRNVCKNADNPSISTSIDSVKTAQNIKMKANTMLFNGIGIWAPKSSPLRITICHSTSDNSNNLKI